MQFVLNGVQGVASSNPAVPTIEHEWNQRVGSNWTNPFFFVESPAKFLMARLGTPERQLHSNAEERWLKTVATPASSGSRNFCARGKLAARFAGIALADGRQSHPTSQTSRSELMTPEPVTISPSDSGGGRACH